MPLLHSLQSGYDQAVAAEFAAQPLTDPAPLTAPDLAHLPDPVRRFIERSGAVGRPRPQNMRVELDAQMWRKPGQAPMAARSLQYNFFGRPARLFLMKARTFGLPVTARHLYRDEAAAFVVRVASLVTITDHNGPVLTAGETVTVLNDMCFFAPGALVDADRGLPRARRQAAPDEGPSRLRLPRGRLHLRRLHPAQHRVRRRGPLTRQAAAAARA